MNFSLYSSSIPDQKQAEGMWHYLMNADNSPRTVLLVFVPAILIMTIIAAYIWLGRRNGKKNLVNLLEDPEFKDEFDAGAVLKEAQEAEKEI